MYLARNKHLDGIIVRFKLTFETFLLSDISILKNCTQGASITFYHLLGARPAYISLKYFFKKHIFLPLIYTNSIYYRFYFILERTKRIGKSHVKCSVCLKFLSF